jgi:hypothetical protein
LTGLTIKTVDFRRDLFSLALMRANIPVPPLRHIAIIAEHLQARRIALERQPSVESDAVADSLLFEFCSMLSSVSGDVVKG